MFKRKIDNGLNFIGAKSCYYNKRDLDFIGPTRPQEYAATKILKSNRVKDT